MSAHRSPLPSRPVEIVLVHPEIAPNTGAIIRLAANTGARLHLVEPLGFALDDRLYSRGGLDYHELADVTVHADLDAATAALPMPWWGFSARATTRFTDAAIGADDVVVFGAEASGLTEAAVERIGADRMLGIPMRAGSRSLISPTRSASWSTTCGAATGSRARRTVARSPKRPGSRRSSGGSRPALPDRRDRGRTDG